jgi:hypothetical protein
LTSPPGASEKGEAADVLGADALDRACGAARSTAASSPLARDSAVVVGPRATQ